MAKELKYRDVVVFVKGFHEGARGVVVDNEDGKYQIIIHDNKYGAITVNAAKAEIELAKG